MPETITMTRGAGADGETFTARPDTAHLDRFADLLDSRFSLFGVRFGVDSLVGFVPGVGDMAGLAMSAYLIGEGYRLGASRGTLVCMTLNALGDTLVGSIPLLGSLVDVFWRSNRQNMRLLREDLETANPVKRF